MNRKITGSYYTPEIISDFIVNKVHALLNSKKNIKILEPSVGEGVILKSLYNIFDVEMNIKSITAVEINKNLTTKIKKEFKDDKVNIIIKDFLVYQRKCTQKFDLIIGNPPYIKKNYLHKTQIKICNEIHSKYVSKTSLSINIWSSFLIRSVSLLSKNGILAFVVPTDLLQTINSNEIRNYLIKEFQKIEVITFNELLFKDGKGQDTAIIIAEKKSNDPGFYFTNVKSVQLIQELISKKVEVSMLATNKWTYFHLSTDEISLIENIKNKSNTIKDYCLSKVGITTAANQYFVLNKETLSRYKLREYSIPILMKGAFINGSVDFKHSDFEELFNKGKQTYLLALDSDMVDKNNKLLQSYLEFGKALGIHKRYKTLSRNNWYSVSRNHIASDGFFLKRCYEYPKIIRNSADILVTDTAYQIFMHNDYKIDNLIFSFYNTFTLIWAELLGRYYGGGVLELSPSEFKNLPLVYIENLKEDFNTYIELFNNKRSIKDICRIYDQEILRSTRLGLSANEVSTLQIIYDKLVSKRMERSCLK